VGAPDTRPCSATPYWSVRTPTSRGKGRRRGIPRDRRVAVPRLDRGPRERGADQRRRARQLPAAARHHGADRLDRGRRPGPAVFAGPARGFMRCSASSISPARSTGLNAAHRCATSWLGRSTSMAHTATTHSSPDHPFHTPGNQGGRSPRHTARRHHPSLGRTRRQPGRHPRRPRPRGPLPGHDRDLTFSAATDQAAAGGDRRSVIGLTR